MDKILKNQTELGKRLLAFGPELDVFEVHAREVAARIANTEPLLQALLKDWPDAPLILQNQEPQPLSWRNRTKEGYSGPRSSYASLPLLPHVEIESCDNFLGQLYREGVKRLVVVYPDRMEEGRLFADMEAMGFGEGIEFVKFPLYKLDGSMTRTFSKDKISLGVRFWSPIAPMVDENYLLVDNIISGGRTLEAMRSFLTEHGVDNSRVKGFVYGIDTGSKAFNDKSLKSILATLRNEDPVTMAKCDLMLDMMGIGGTNALNPAEFVEIYYPNAAGFRANIETELRGCHRLPLEVDRNYLNYAAKYGIVPGR